MLCQADVPYCPEGPQVSREECLSVSGCHWDNTSSRTKSLCYVQCTSLTNVEDCNNPRSSKCHWDENDQACYWIYNCPAAPTKEKCTRHPSLDLSCIWDTTNSQTPHCRTAKCYDYDEEPYLCITDDNLECILEKSWCRDLTCPEIDNINDCRNKVGDSCVWQYGACLQAPCTQWPNASVCLEYGFCRWRNATGCVKAVCTDLKDKSGCESFYTEKYVDTCAWSSEGTCFHGSDCKDFSTKIGCLVGGGPCIWTSDQVCVNR